MILNWHVLWIHNYHFSPLFWLCDASACAEADRSLKKRRETLRETPDLFDRVELGLMVAEPKFGVMPLLIWPPQLNAHCPESGRTCAARQTPSPVAMTVRIQRASLLVRLAKSSEQVALAAIHCLRLVNSPTPDVSLKRQIDLKPRDKPWGVARNIQLLQPVQKGLTTVKAQVRRQGFRI